MNGQFLPISPATTAAGPGSLRPAAWSGSANAALPRLLAAFALSCLLHAALVFLPFLGMSTVATRYTFSGGERAQTPGVSAVLVSTGGREPAPANVSASTPAVTQPAAVRPPAEPAKPAVQARSEGSDRLPIAAPAYYSTDQLTKRPQPLAAVELDAPETRAFVVSGKLALNLWINELGMVVDVTVEKSELPEIFSRTAVAAFKALRFEPGERMGQPVATVMRIEVNYDDGRLLQR